MRVMDFGSRADYWAAMMPAVVLALSAVVVLMIEAFARPGAETAEGAEPGGRASVAFLVTMYAMATALVASVSLGDATGPPDALIALDGFRGVAELVLLGAGLLVVALSRDYAARTGMRGGEFHALLLLALTGMLVVAAARDLILLFVGIELMSISVYVLAGYARRNPRSSEASVKYFIMGAFASAFLLYGIALLYGATGTTRLSEAALAISSGAAAGDLLLAGGVGMLLIGLGFKVAAVPFHMWTPDAYEGAPFPVTAFMATGVKAAAFVAVLRIFTVDLAGAHAQWAGAVWWLAALTMIVPNLVALQQQDLKRMLAYSSVAHAGYLLVGVAAMSDAGRSGALFYLGAYAVTTAAALALVSHLAAGRGGRSLRDFRGLGWEKPWLSAALVVLLLSLAGFPPTAGFVGKLFLLRAGLAAGEFGLAVILVLSSLVSYYYYLRVVWKMYFEESPEGASGSAPALRGAGGFRWIVVGCALAVLAAGLFPGRLIEGVEAATARAPVAADGPEVAGVEVGEAP